MPCCKRVFTTAGINYEEMFEPVAQLDSLQLLLNLVAVFDWEIHQIDIKSAYLNGNLHEGIYMEQPKGFMVQGDVTYIRQSMV